MIKALFRCALLCVLASVCLGNFRAYNDCIRGSGDTTAANVTNWTVYSNFTSNMSGPLIDFASGQQTPITATFTWDAAKSLGVSETSGSSDGVSQPRPGTPAYEVFGEIVDFSNRCIYYGSTGWWVEVTFTGLHPDKNYTFVTTAIRADTVINRLTLFTLSGHTSAVNTSSDGIYLKDGDQTVLMAAGNHLNTTGYVVRWDTIRVADRGDGTGQFSVRAQAYGSDYRAYPFGGFMLEQAGNAAPTVNAGGNRTIHRPLAYATLTGTITDDGEGDPKGFLECSWSQVSGPAAVAFVSDIHQPEVRVHFPAAGAYVLRLTAGDGELSAWQDVTVTVADPLCPLGDMDGDCRTTLADLELLATGWLENGTPGAADLTGDRRVDIEELGLLAQSWQEDWTGSVAVTISPAEAAAGGARWRVDGGDWQMSGDVVGVLAEGAHRIEYSTTAGWVRPEGQDIIIVRQETTAVAGEYYIPPQTLAISEFMAVNSNVSDLRPMPSVNMYTFVDGRQVYEDWIEVQNLTDAAVSLDGWYLTDNANNLTKWQFPAGYGIPARGTLVVYASNKDIEKYGYPFVDTLGSLHTNFELAMGGEYLALVRPDGLWIEHTYGVYPKQQGLVSYGIGSDGRIGYLTGVTRGTANTGIYEGVVGDTSFSVKRGIYDAPFSVLITCSTPDAVIRYTTDTSEPTAGSGIIYNPAAPIAITKTTCLRAAAFKAGHLPSNVDTQTYLFLDDVPGQATHPATGKQVTPAGYPTSWGSVTGDYQVDPNIASPTGSFGHLYAATLKDDLKAIPSLSVVVPISQFFAPTTGIYINQAQDGTERAGSIEFIDPTGTEAFHTRCGVRMQGGANHDGGGTTLDRWKCYKLSMRLTFRGVFGGMLEYPVFGAGAAEDYDTLILDSRPQNTWVHSAAIQRIRGEYVRDQAASDTQLAMGGTACHGRPVHLYLNGLYWGLYWLHERPDDAFAASYLGGVKGDYDVIKHDAGNVISGDNTDYIAMFALAANAPDAVTAFNALSAKLDVPDFIDYLLANFYLGNGDWDNKNWYATHNRFDPAGRWRWHMWDGEHVMDDGSMAATNVTSKNTAMAPTGLHQKWVANAEYRMLFADRVHKHFFHDGALTPANFAALFTNLTDQIDRAIVPESARWGDNRQSIPCTRDAEWLTEVNRLLTTFIPGRRNVVLNQLTAKSPAWYPTVAAPEFSISGSPQYGGDAPTGALLTMSTGGNTVWYTLDGSDPRLPGGEINTASATVYGTAIGLNKSVPVKARARTGAGVWSALAEAVFDVGPVKETLRITEVMYHHPAHAELEFIELKNIGAEPLNLNRVQFTKGIAHTFGDVPVAPGGFVVLVRNKALFESYYTVLPAGVTVIEWTQGALDNAGETLTLVDALGRTILSFAYKDTWYPLTDGAGFSLTIQNAMNPDLTAWDAKAGWRASTAAGGTPGADETGLAPGSIVINELLAHSHEVLPDWIELHNTTAQAISIGGWFLSDSGDDLMKYEIPADTAIAANGYAVFYENLHFGAAFAFSEYGETAYLTSGADGQLTGYQVSQAFDASERSVPLGRYLKSDGNMDFVALTEATPGAANALPQVGPVVFTEIQYYPHASNKGDEYIELYNITSSPVMLQELVPTETSPGVFEDEVIPWAFTEGITYSFPLNTQIPAGGILILAKNPTAFMAYYGATLPAGTPVLGPFAADTSLSNGGEKVRLCKPGEQAFGKARAWIRAEQVTYDDESPWPVEPDGGGKTLRRLAPAAYGNDPANWTAADPTPGVL